MKHNKVIPISYISRTDMDHHAMQPKDFLETFDGKIAKGEERLAAGDGDGDGCHVAMVVEPKRPSSWLRRHLVQGLEWDLVKGIAQNLWPMLALTLCQALLATICLMFTGHLSTTELAGVSLALTVLSITGFSFAEGLTSASQTHFSQSFGSGQTSRMDMYLVKSLLVLPFFLLPCVAIHVNMEYILTFAGQRPEIARISGRFLLICIPALLVSQCHYIFMDYMTCQNIRMMATASSFCGFLTATLFNYIFVYVMELRTDGSALALALAACVMLAIDIIYVIVTKRKHWAGFTTEVFMDWLPMIGIALAGILMMCLEWWALEIAVVITSFVGEVELSSLSVVINLHIITTIIPISFSMGASILVGQHLGAGEVDKMKNIVKLAYILIAVIQFVFAVVMFGSRYYLPRMFTSDTAVINLVGELLSVHVVSVFCSGIMNVSVGVMRGSGRQGLTSVVILVGLYVIGLPLGAVLMFFTDMKVKGIVTGLAVGVVFEVVAILVVIGRTDWDRQSRLARKRVKAEVDLVVSGHPMQNGHETIPLQQQEIAPIATPEPSIVGVKHRLTACVALKRLLLIGSLVAVLFLGVLLRLLVLTPPGELCTNDPIFNGTSLPYGIKYCPPPEEISGTLSPL